MAAEASSSILHLTDETFAAEVIDFDGAVFIDFWAEWCHPCHQLAPTIEKLAEKYHGNPKVKIAKLDIEEAQKTAENYRIMSIPTLMTFVKGEQMEMNVGVQQLATLEKMIEKALQAN